MTLSKEIIARLRVEQQLVDEGLLSASPLLTKILEGEIPTTVHTPAPAIVAAAATAATAAKTLTRSTGGWTTPPPDFEKTLRGLAKKYGVGKLELALGYREFGTTRKGFSRKEVRVAVLEKVQLIQETGVLEPYLPLWVKPRRKKRSPSRTYPRHTISKEQHEEVLALIQILIAQGWTHSRIGKKAGVSTAYSYNLLQGYQPRTGIEGYFKMSRLADKLGLPFKSVQSIQRKPEE